MVNAETGRITDMLESRETADASAWLATFPNIKVVSRDGSAMYAAAIKTAHPDAMQVSDRFHIFKGLTDALRQYISSMISPRIRIESETAPSSYWQKEPNTEADLPQRLHNETTERRAANIQKVRELGDSGLSISRICEMTGHSPPTVKKYLHPDFQAEFQQYGVTRPSKLKPYCGTIDSMIAERRTFREISAKIRELGYHGSESTIRMYATRKRRLDQALYDETRKNSEVIERKYILKLLYRPIEKIKGITKEQPAKVIAVCPQLTAAYDLVSSYKALFAARHVEDLEQWLESAKTLGSPDVDSCVNGIKRDIDAVKNAILHSHNNGLAEGSVNKIKRIKHMMYGRASFSTLRTKVLMYENWRFVN
jgi:transposase